MKRANKLNLSVAMASALTLAAMAETESDLFLHGVDLGYVNEMLDAGEEYRMNGQVVDPYEIFGTIGAEIVRLRLWHNPAWGDGYSGFDDVARAIRASKQADMQIMLSIQYSDSWTDPGKAIVPAAWADHVDDTEKLGDLMYAYTVETLRKLDEMGLMPELVSVGNENNSGIMNEEEWSKDFVMDWPRQVYLFNRGIQAVRDAGRDSAIQPKVMIHIAQPHNVEYWFDEAFAAGLAKIDYIGFSYYSPWCPLSTEEVGQVVNRIQHKFQTQTFMVETAYPWTMLWENDKASNMMGEQALRRGYPATIRGQREYMTDLCQVMIDHGCAGVAYWEPAWVSSDRPTLWGVGSHWENMTFFDFRKGKNELHKGCEYLKHDYTYPTPVEFRITADDTIEKLYFWGDFIGGDDFAIELKRDDSGEFVFKDRIKAGTKIKYQIFAESPVVDGKLKISAVENLLEAEVGEQKLILRIDGQGKAVVEKIEAAAPAAAPKANPAEINELLDILNRN